MARHIERLEDELLYIEDNTTYDEMDQKEPRTSRRVAVGGAIIAAGAVAVGSGVFFTRERSTSPRVAVGANDTENGEVAIASGVQSSASTILFPEIREGRVEAGSWSDAERYFGKSAEELKDIFLIPVNNETRSKEGLVVAIEQRVNGLLNIVRSEDHIIEAHEMMKSNAVNDFGEYAGLYIDSAFPFTDTIEGKSGIEYNAPNVVEDLKSTVHWYAKQYEKVPEEMKLGRPYIAEGIANDVPYFTVDGIRSEYTQEFDHSLSLDYTMSGWVKSDVTYKGLLNIYALAGSDGNYILYPQRFKKELQ